MHVTSKKGILGGLALLLSGGTYFIGQWLVKIYGLDPPYFPFYLGVIFQLILAPLLALSALVFFTLAVTRTRKASKNAIPPAA